MCPDICLTVLINFSMKSSSVWKSYISSCMACEKWASCSSLWCSCSGRTSSCHVGSKYHHLVLVHYRLNYLPPNPRQISSLTFKHRRNHVLVPLWLAAQWLHCVVLGLTRAAEIFTFKIYITLTGTRELMDSHSHSHSHSSTANPLHRNPNPGPISELKFKHRRRCHYAVHSVRSTLLNYYSSHWNRELLPLQNVTLHTNINLVIR